VSLRRRPEVSPRMIAANRADAQKSTRPRRKARLALNALKHGGYTKRLFRSHLKSTDSRVMLPLRIRIQIPKTGIRLQFWVRSPSMVWPRLGHSDFPGPPGGWDSAQKGGSLEVSWGRDWQGTLGALHYAWLPCLPLTCRRVPAYNCGGVSGYA
jgi:hypothetical protein